jgi:hypothetical protein
MSGERKLIRDWAFALLADQFAVPVHKERKIDTREEDEFFNVYCTNNIEFQQDGMRFFSRANLIIGFHLKGFDADDQLEIMSDQVMELLLGSRVPESISGIVPELIEDNGDQEGRQFNSVYMSFTVIY